MRAHQSWDAAAVPGSSELPRPLLATGGFRTRAGLCTLVLKAPYVLPKGAAFPVNGIRNTAPQGLLQGKIQRMCSVLNCTVPAAVSTSRY